MTQPPKNHGGGIASRVATTRPTRGARTRAGSTTRRNLVNYPRAGREGWKRWIPGWRLVLALLLGLVALGALLFALAWALIDVPEPGDFAMAETTEVYYNDGTTMMGQYSEFNRESVALTSLPEHVGHAVIASEDRRFYDNNGVDLVGTTRALVNNLQGKPTQGGSTLTQQYVERYYLDTTTSYVGKFKEAILALKINLQQPKNEVLENYLNTIYFGRGAYGVETASQAYFGKPAAEMTPAESALLAGIIPAPSSWDPAKNPEKAEQRWERVMDLMVSEGYLSQEDRDAATFPETIDPRRDNNYAGPQGYLLDMVRSELRDKAGLTDEQIDRGGYRIVTTFDKHWQDVAIETVASLPESRPENNHVAMVSVDPRTGAIRMLYGGEDYLKKSRNGVTQDRAMAGSTFKPFTMLAALEQGISVNRTYTANSPMRIRGWGGQPVRNFMNHSWGAINMGTATANSVNTYYAQLNRDAGPENTVDAAVRAGLPENTPGLEPYPSNVLGPSSPRPIDMARAYSTIAGNGVRHEPYSVETVTDRDDQEIYKATHEGTQVFEPEVTANATWAMRQVVERGSAQKVAVLGRQIAGKTGTSQDNRSAWFIGYIPQVVTVVAMYESDEAGNEVPLTDFGGVYGITGSTYPANLWRDYMRVVTDGLEVERFPDRVGVRDTGPRSRSGTSQRRTQAPRTQAPRTQAPQTPATQAPEPTEAPETQAPEPAPTPEAEEEQGQPAPTPAQTSGTQQGGGGDTDEGAGGMQQGGGQAGGGTPEQAPEEPNEGTAPTG